MRYARRRRAPPTSVPLNDVSDGCNATRAAQHAPFTRTRSVAAQSRPTRWRRWWSRWRDGWAARTHRWSGILAWRSPAQLRCSPVPAWLRTLVAVACVPPIDTVSPGAAARARIGQRTSQQVWPMTIVAGGVHTFHSLLLHLAARCLRGRDDFCAGTYLRRRCRVTPLHRRWRSEWAARVQH